MSSCSLNITFEIVDVVKQDQSEARFYYTYFKVEGNATANPAGCVIVMPGDLVNDDEGDDEDEDDERNSETAALTSSC